MGNLIILLFFILSFAIWQSATPVYAAFRRKDVGTSSGVFLKLPSGARAISMGDAFGPIADDALSVRYNPAGMPQVKGIDISMTHSVYFASTFHDHILAVLPLGRRAAFGVAATYFNGGNITKRDEYGLDIGTAKPSDFALTAALGYRFDTNRYSDVHIGWGLGASVTQVQSKLTKRAECITVSAGIMSPTDKKWRVSLVGDNLIGKLKFDIESAPLPFVIRIGASRKLPDAALLSGEFFLPRDDKPFAAVGGEKNFVTGEDWSLLIRGGYTTRYHGSLSWESGFSLGIGISLGISNVDYAFSPIGDLGFAHRLSFGVNFGSWKRRHKDNYQRRRERSGIKAIPEQKQAKKNPKQIIHWIE